MLKKILLGSLLALCSHAYEDPKIVGVPPADAGRGLVRISKKEIRHYTGNRRDHHYIVSRDNGQTWTKEQCPETYPPNFGGISKESPAITPFPGGKEFIRIQPIRGHVFISKGGIDGVWGAVTKDGKLDFDWAKLSEEERKEKYKHFTGIIRSPFFVNKGKRIIIPYHWGSTKFHISDDGGLTWHQSKNNISSPSHKIDEIDKGTRWQNGGVECSVVELRDGRLWAVVRTSQNHHYESFSEDFGTTWSKAVPSRFPGTLTMITLKTLHDGRIISSWTNTKALPEAYRSNSKWMKEKGYKRHGGEDAFTNRDSHHLAISDDDGKTWKGFREIILDEHRNHSQYATMNGGGDRGKHQSELIQIAKNKILISVGQHPKHRKLMIVDLAFLDEKKRENSFKNGLDDWTIHAFIPYVKGHCAYHRKPSSELVKQDGKPALQVRRLNDPELINKKYEINYEKGGATWNFPNGEKGLFKVRFKMDKNSEGTQLSLTDRLFNAGDETTEKFAVYTLNLKPKQKLGRTKLKADTWYTLTFKWNGTKEDSECRVYLNGNKKAIHTLKPQNTSPNGLSYVHFISTAEKEDQGIYIQKVSASVK